MADSTPCSSRDLDVCHALQKLIEEETTSGQKSLDPNRIKQMKKICKRSDQYVDQAFHLLMTQMSKNHSEIRLSTFLIIDELFTRSHKFRELLVADLQTYLELSMEIDFDEPLPPPKAAAKLLKQKAIEAIKLWHQRFGTDYKKLDLAYDFLKHSKKVNLEDIDTRTVAERQREAERRGRIESVNQDRLKKTLEEILDMEPEIDQCLTEIENCFQLLIPHPGDNPSGHTAGDPGGDPSDPSNSGTSGTQSNMRQHGLNSWQYGLTINVSTGDLEIKEDEDNTSILSVLNELNRLITTKFLPAVNKWLEVLTKVGAEQAHLKKVINLKMALNSKNDKYGQLNIIWRPKKPRVVAEADSDDDGEFEEVVEKEGYEPVIPEHLREEYGLEPLKNDSQKKDKLEREELQDPTSRTAALMAMKKRLGELKSNLSVQDREAMTASTSRGLQPTSSNSCMSEELSKAPFVPFDTDLTHWGQEDKIEAPEVVRYDSLCRFWKTKENDEISSQALKDSLVTRTINFSGNFKPVEWKCRAPLADGKLCQRQDRHKCPFHGKIIGRDNEGNPSNKFEDDGANKKKKNEESRPLWMDAELQRDIEATIGEDLGSSGKGMGKRKGKKRKYPNLTQLNKEDSTPTSRLEKIVFNKSSMKRVVTALDNLDKKQSFNRFANNFNYSLSK